MMILVYFIVFMGIGNISEAANSLSFCGQPKTWIEAKTFCETKGGRLLNRGADNDALFLQRADIPSNQEIWFGQYRGLSGWMEQLGCFDERSLGVSWYSIQAQNNSAAICQTLCNATDYFALQGSSCLCSYNNYVNTSWLAPKTNCFQTCPGNATEMCGGTGSMTVYHRVNGDLILYESYPHLQCVIMNCSSSSNWTYYEHSCEDSLTSLCGSGVLVNQPASWLTGQAYCKQYGSLIGLYNMVGSCAIAANNLRREFWIGLYRNEVDLSLKDRSVQNPVIGCYSIVKQYSASFPFITQFYPIQICEKQKRLPFICELPPGNPTEDGCSLPSTTTSVTTTINEQMLVVAQEDDGLKTGLYIGLGVVLLAAVIVVVILVTRRKKSNPGVPRLADLLNALTQIRRRRNQEDAQSATPQAKENLNDIQAGDAKHQYALVNKPLRPKSAPEIKVYTRPVTSLTTDIVVDSVSNIGYDTLQIHSATENQQKIETPSAQNSILKLNDNEVNEKHTIEEECKNKQEGGAILSVPKKSIPILPPLLKYPLDSHGNNYEHIGTTVL